MIMVKHVLDTVEPEDGERIWVEPIGLTRDLRKMCRVHHVLPHLGPPLDAWDLLQNHPSAYDYFRARYHEHLNDGPFRIALRELAAAGLAEDFTLIHQGDDPDRNSAVALREYLNELEAYCPPEDEVE
jgi:uncharacterized protein YeaO (DUF488 family)